MRRAGQAPCRCRPVSSTLGLAGGNARVQRAASALRSHPENSNTRDRYCGLSCCSVVCAVQALRAGQSQRSSSLRPGVRIGWRFAPACCAAQSVCGRTAHGRTGSSCRRRARGTRGRQRFGCQCPCQRSCGRGLTGRSTGGATAGRLARVAQLAYPPPRGQGSLPRPPGYLYVRPRWLHGAQAQRASCALRACPSFRSRAERAALRSRAVVQVRVRRFAPGKASVLRRCAQGSVVVGASRRRAAPRSQFVGAPRTDGLACLAAAVHAAREGGSVSVANVGTSAGAGAA